MLSALALLVAGQGILGPALAPGVRPEFSQSCIQVEEALEKGDFAEAARRARLLPKKIVTVEWKDAKVPESRRETFAMARDAAFAAWRQNLGSDYEFRVKPSGGDIRFEFQPSLAEDPASGLPAGAALFFADSDKQPRVEAFIGLNRGKPVQETDGKNVQNEVSHAIGAYFGLATSPFSGSTMGRSDLPLGFVLEVSSPEAATVKANQRAVGILMDAIEKKTPLVAARPSIVYDPVEIVEGPVVQGERIRFTVAISNNGNAPLVYRAQPDCGCINPEPGNRTVLANSTDRLNVFVDTSEIAGVLNKHLLILSNDPQDPIRVLPLKVTATPRYRLLSSAPQTLIVPEGGATFDVFLITPEGKPIEVVDAKVSGIEGKVTRSAWSGKMADPELNEPERSRSGTKFHVELEEQLLDGRAPVTLSVLTKDPQFKVLKYTAYVQKGIVLLPDRVYFGQLGSDVRKSMFLISRPGMPFKVLSVKADSAHLKAEVKPTRGEWEYQVTVTYTGKAPSGDFTSTVTVATDDPTQPTLRATVQGVVK